MNCGASQKIRVIPRLFFLSTFWGQLLTGQIGGRLRWVIQQVVVPRSCFKLFSIAVGVLCAAKPYSYEWWPLWWLHVMTSILLLIISVVGEEDPHKWSQNKRQVLVPVLCARNERFLCHLFEGGIIWPHKELWRWKWGYEIIWLGDILPVTKTELKIGVKLFN